MNIDLYIMLNFGIIVIIGAKEVKQKYKELVKQYHPDVCSWDSTAYFQKINNAYEVALDFASKNKRVHKPHPLLKLNIHNQLKRIRLKRLAHIHETVVLLQKHLLNQAILALR